VRTSLTIDGQKIEFPTSRIMLWSVSQKGTVNITLLKRDVAMKAAAQLIQAAAAKYPSTNEPQ